MTAVADQTQATVCGRCGTVVPGDARFCPSCGASASRIAPGQILDGKYEILEKTGEGGMGEVFKARHIHLDEIRIIKVTKADPLGEGPEPRRFQEEARIATLIRHPNVAALYDFSRMPDGSYYMVWEFIDGITLEAWLRRYGPLLAPRALEVSHQVLAGLEEIHAQGIVHRDLSPDNIMIRETKDGRLSAKIIDLGIAKRVASEALSMTGTGMFVGKLKYCSPEQAGALAPGETVDGRSDLYSFGVVLYEMLTGKAPFESQTPQGYLGKHLHAMPPPLDTARIPAVIAPGLASIVTKALEKHRDRRFADAHEFSTALAKLQTGPDNSTDSIATSLLPESGRRGGWGWLVGGAIALSAAVAVLAFVLHRPAGPMQAASRTTPSPIPETSPSPAPQKDAADAVVIQPRILEDETPAARPTLRPTRVAPAAPVPTEPPAPEPPSAIGRGVPAAAPSPVAMAGGPVDLPGVGELTARRIRRIVDDWSAKPVEKRAMQAVRIAYLANQWIRANPSDPTAIDLTKTLPGALREGSNELLAAKPPRPGLAFEFATAYLQLSFAPPDPEMQRRVTMMRPRFRPGARRQSAEEQ